MVGIGTVLKDNPRLTVRLKDKKGNDPHRIIADSRGNIPLDSNVITVQSDAKTIVATTSRMPLCASGRVDLEKLMRILHQREIDAIILEGGGTLNYSMHFLGLVDKVIYFIAPKILGGKDAATSVDGKGFSSLSDGVELEKVSSRFIGNDLLVEGYVRKGRM